MVRWWLHEIQRVFGDRLTTPADSDLLWQVSIDTCSEVLHAPFIDNSRSQPDKQKLIWADMGLATNGYEEVADLDKLVQAGKTYLEEYNKKFPHQAMDLHLFGSAVEHVARILRVLRQPQGHVLLLGKNRCFFLPVSPVH
jgi:dynein heavy chain, axonemal